MNFVKTEHGVKNVKGLAGLKIVKRSTRDERRTGPKTLKKSTRFNELITQRIGKNLRLGKMRGGPPTLKSGGPRTVPDLLGNLESWKLD
jgi:hypothetical protein